MTSNNSASPPGHWSGVGYWTLFGTLAVTLISVAFTAVLFHDLSNAVMQRALMVATLLPIMMGVPLFFYVGLRMRGLALTNNKLGLVARTDSLTSCLNRGAFTSQVDAHLGKIGQDEGGALLMIDADNFKAINDLFGHDSGDEALTIIARSIRTIVRSGDLVGRMGGEEFGVYLPGVDLRKAEIIAERIRRSVSLAVFAPGGDQRHLSVSIGGAVFSGPVSFSALFRIADQRLYGAKETGRNRVTIGHVDDSPVLELRQSA